MKALDINEGKNQVIEKKERLYTSWKNSKGIECKMIGPETKCLCDHRYKEHNHEIHPIKTHCKSKKCTCPQFLYIPTYGSYDFKCLCKHSYKFHDPITRHCTKGNCGGCIKGFNSAWTCACGAKFNEHTTIFETTGDRKLLGKPVDDMERMMGELDTKGIEGDPVETTKENNFGVFFQDDLKKKQKLKELNRKIEKQKINPLPEKSSSQQDFSEDYCEESVSALKLYQTPHFYIRYNLKF